ncbi:MAG: SHOCT domain-containing protein [Hyphomicrobiaceae bacterium]|nr:SHOCT domain-containing protein [Hyphomicrobiaceae bacterium]
MMNFNTFMDGFGGFWGFGMFLGPVIMIGFWALVLYLFIALITRIGGRSNQPGPLERSPLELLKERYARGDIDRYEYAQSKKNLQQ